MIKRNATELGEEHLQPVSAYLRRSTMAAHQTTESKSFMKAFLDRSLDHGRYVATMEQLFGVLRPIEQSLTASPYLKDYPSVQDRTFYRALLKDASFLGFAERTLSEPEFAPPTLPSSAAVAGILYVLEGSANGGAMIHRILQSRLNISADEGLAYFSLQADLGRQRFALFKEDIDGKIFVDDFDEVAHHAVATFQRFEL